MPFADHNAILDPTCSDLTARTLELLGYIGFDSNQRSVRDAVQYLIDTQEDDGSWYGRWGVNYIYGTWQVLRGLRAIGAGHDAGLDSARTRLAGELPERRRRLGRNVRHLRRSGVQRQRPEHGVANGVGVDGNLRHAAISIVRAFTAVCVICLALSSQMVPGTSRKSQGRVFRGCSI